MRLQSITTRLLGLVGGAFLLLAVLVIMLSNRELVKMIDASQDVIYSDKLDGILETLSQQHQLLESTLMVEAYREDLQRTVLRTLRQAHYKETNPTIYPVIFDERGVLVMHPVLPRGSDDLAQSPFMQQARDLPEGDFVHRSSDGRERWGTYKSFAPWGWKVGYTVPLDIKYADAHAFRKTLILIMSAITAFVVFVLSVLLTRSITRPIVNLTRVSAAMARGDLVQDITIHTKDEIGKLARIFVEMRDSIRGKIEQLELEIAERKRAETALEQHRSDLEAIVQDRTAELENRTQDLIVAKEAAELATQCKSEFLANMSHEIRTPMTAILGFAETIADNVENPENVDAIATVRRNAEYLLVIISDILDLSKVEAGKMEMEIAAHSPCDVIAEVASLVKIRAQAKALAFEVEYIGAIPETIQTDATRLRQILINLIGNAIKFTEVGGVRLISRFVQNDDEPFMQFDVLDTGIGMTDEQTSRLFQPFGQADSSTTRRFGGTGLGLTISKRFAELLGGDITIVETEFGVGTRFRATIPTGSMDGIKMIEDPRSIARAGSQRDSAAPLADLTGRRVLLAEDGPDNQRLISYVLRKAGAEVVVAENGKLALDAALAAKAEGNAFDCILMDMQMPVMSGYEATTALRDASYTGPIIAVTAHAMADDRKKCVEAGCDDFATKPIDRAKLIDLVAQYSRRADIAA